MFYSLLVKGVSGLAVAGIVTTGALYFGTDLFKKEEGKKESISSLIRKVNPEKRLITATEGKDSHWQAAWKLYREKNQNSEKDVWSVDGWQQSSGTVQASDAPEAFVRACSSKSSIQVFNKEDTLYSQVLTYCTRDTLVSDWVWGIGHEMVPSDNNEEAWKELWKKYNDNKESAWQLTGAPQYQQNQVAPAQFKAKCRDESNLVRGNENDVSVNRVFLYCSRKRADAK